MRLNKILWVAILFLLPMLAYSQTNTPTATATPKPTYLPGLASQMLQGQQISQFNVLLGSTGLLTNTPTTTFTPTNTWTPTNTFTPMNTLPPGTNTYTPTNTYTSTPTYTSTASYTPTANATQQVYIYSADVLAPVQVNLASNIKTADLFTAYSIAPTGSTAATIMVYDEAPGQSVTTNNVVNNVCAHAVLNGETTITGLALKSLYIVPRITPTQTCVVTYVIGVDKAL